MPYTITCKTCGNSFETDMQNRKFCSRPCQYKGYKKPSNPIEFTCEHCGKQFLKYPGYHNLKATHHFCSKKCHCLWQQSEHPVGSNHPHFKSVEVPCSNCGKTLIRKPYRLKDYKEQFCNHTCFGQWRAINIAGANHPLWKGGYAPYYGSNWMRQSAAARKRDGYKCQHCGISEKKNGRKLDVHHIVSLIKFDNFQDANRLSNLITLCPSCHKRAEHNHVPIQLYLLSGD